MTTLKTLTALTIIAFLAACSGADRMAFTTADYSALNAIATHPIAPLY